MKKIFMILVVLFLIYLAIQVGYSFFGEGHNVDYKVVTEDKEFFVKEHYNNKKNDIKSYFFEIDYNSDVFYYQTEYNFKKNKQVIKNIYYYHDDTYSCILPVYEKNQIISDVLCKKDNTIYNYNDISGADKNLDNYIATLDKVGYSINNYKDNSEILDKSPLKIHDNNVLKETYYGLANYKGLYLINYSIGGKVKKVELFEKDVYKRPISIFFKNYYVVADYNKDYRFDTFYTVDITNSKIKQLKVGKEISFDGYIQGTDNNSIYFFDKTTKTQYEINIKSNKIIEVGNENTGIKILENGEWNRISASSAVNNNILFTNDTQSNSSYDKIDKIGTNAGYYYMYAKNNNGFKVYRTNIQNNNQNMYLFNASDYNKVIYNKEYVYYIEDDCVKYYSDVVGNRKLLCYSELKYNNDLIFGVYNNY